MRRLRDVGAALAGAVIAGIVAVLAGNSILMPHFVRHQDSRQVPDVVGAPVEEARRTCFAAGLQLVEDAGSHSVDLPPGHVVSQIPAAGTPVRPGRGVRVTVSLGREAVSVPNLRGMTLRQARLELANAQLVLGDVCRIASDPAGEIVRVSSPRAGTEAARGDSIDLVVTTGVENEPFLVPSLVGQEMADVRALVESRGFRIGRVTGRPSGGAFPGTVLEQYPPRGSWIRRGDTVDLVVANSD